MISEVEHTLKTPVNLANGTKLTVVRLEEIDIGTMVEIEDAGLSQGQQGLRVLAAMAGLSIEDFRKIKTSDAVAIKNLMEKTWGNASTDGEESPS